MTEKDDRACTVAEWIHFDGRVRCRGQTTIYLHSGFLFGRTKPSDVGCMCVRAHAIQVYRNRLNVRYTQIIYLINSNKSEPVLTLYIVSISVCFDCRSGSFSGCRPKLSSVVYVSLGVVHLSLGDPVALR